jgi:hypothetical protein
VGGQKTLASLLLTSRQLRRQTCCTFPRRLVSRGMKRDGRSFDHRTLNRLNIGLPVILMT